MASIRGRIKERVKEKSLRPRAAPRRQSGGIGGGLEVMALTQNTVAGMSPQEARCIP